MDLIAGFAADVGPADAGPVTAVGGRSQWHVGGLPVAGTREVRAPTGVAGFEPAEMVVRVCAGTAVRELDAALAERGQMVPLDPPPASAGAATVGGVLAVGHSGLRRLRYGPIRDTLLEVTYVSADGTVIRAGAPVVKNVTGYDLCRLLVGSLGTLGFLAEVVLRCQPVPIMSCWLQSRPGADPFVARRALFRPSSILWDGDTTWVLLEGDPTDIAAETGALGRGWTEAAGPPALPDGPRASLGPGQLRGLEADAGSFLAEIGVGTAHGLDRPPAPSPPAVVRLNQRVKDAFDPTGRMNPGRTVIASRASASEPAMDGVGRSLTGA